MKKLIGLVIALITFVNLSVLGQCPTLKNHPRFYGDMTPCRNQKNVPYSVANDDLSITSLAWSWCPTSSFTPTYYQWSVDPNSGAKISDGVKISNTAGLLITTSTTVYVSYKTKDTYLGCSIKDSCGVYQAMYGRSIILNCSPTDDPFGAYVPPVVPDTGRTINGATVTVGTLNMSFNFTSISGETGPYTNLNLYKKCPSCTCASNRAVEFSDGWYQQVLSVPYPTKPLVVQFGWDLLYFGTNQTLRMGGGSTTGYWMTLPFTIDIVSGTTTNYTTLP